jgi:hypothetical protein
MFAQTHFPVEEPVAEPVLEAILGCDEETRLQYAGGLPVEGRMTCKRSVLGKLLRSAPIGIASVL